MKPFVLAAVVALCVWTLFVLFFGNLGPLDVIAASMFLGLILAAVAGFRFVVARLR